MTARLRTRAQVRQWLACLDAAATLVAPAAAATEARRMAGLELMENTTLDLADLLYAGLRARVPAGIKVCSAQQRRRTPIAFAAWLLGLAAQRGRRSS